MFTDCDDDTLLIRAKCLGDGVVCHTGARTCFYTPVTLTRNGDGA